LPTHTPLVQSLAEAQPNVGRHFGQIVPPQSMSVSEPFSMTSSQRGIWHLPPLHTPLWQSSPAPHSLPLMHALGQLPPQSTSDSS
jgi:hypothetical protein